MAAFAADMRAFQIKIEARTRAVFHGVVTEVTRSVVEGSDLTGAPGQLVDTGNLRASFHTSYPTADTAELSTNVVYARMAEEGRREDGRAITQRSEVGGFHSIALTIAGYDRIAAHVNAVTP